MKTIVITGASKGIGCELAKKFKSENYNVVGTYLSSSLQAEKLSKDYDIDFKRVDVSSYSQVKDFFDYVIKTYKKIDIVINNAGISYPSKFIADVCEEEFDKIVSVNFKGAFNTLKFSILNMLENGGKIVNTSSIYTLDNGSCEAVYTATKYALNGLSKTASYELSNSKIQVCTVILGLIDTDMNSHLTLDEKISYVKELGYDKIPLASDVANSLYEILTKNDNVNGKEFKIYTGKL